MLVFKNTSDTSGGMKPEIQIQMIMMVINMMPIRIITMWMMLIMIMI